MEEKLDKIKSAIGTLFLGQILIIVGLIAIYCK